MITLSDSLSVLPVTIALFPHNNLTKKQKHEQDCSPETISQEVAELGFIPRQYRSKPLLQPPRAWHPNYISIKISYLVHIAFLPLLIHFKGKDQTLKHERKETLGDFRFVFFFRLL